MTTHRTEVKVRPEILSRIKAEGRQPVIASMGGGLDSWAMLLAAVDRGVLPDVCVFMDVGNCDDRSVPAEWPGTYRYVNEIMKPFAESHGIQWVTITHHDYPVRPLTDRQSEALTALADSSKAKVGKKELGRLVELGLVSGRELTDKGRRELAKPGSEVGWGSLFEWMWSYKNIPVSGPNRNCTKLAKVERFESWLNDNFAGETCEVWIGFGAEPKEQKRADRGDPYSATSKPEAGKANRVNRFPLIEWDICRCRSVELVKEHGYPVPFGSACVFCPYGQMTDFQKFAAELPEQFERVCELEEQKPKTANGYQLTIKGWSKRKLKDGTVVVSEPWLRDWVKGQARRGTEACPVCGNPVAVRKDVGCGFADD